MSFYQKALYFLAIALFIACVVFLVIGFNKINDYGYDNRYVGGDAYNYIINGTYFAGYLALSSGCLISSVILFVAGRFIKQN